MEKKLGPDLCNGYAIVGNKDSKNLWRTEIRSILHKNLDGEKAYLTHECRAEAVSRESIFRLMNYEFAAIKSWLGNYIIRSGAFMGAFGYAANPGCYQKGIDIDVECPDVPIYEYSFSEAFERIRSNKPGRLFIKIDYGFLEESWTAYSPARYINYLNPDKNMDEYLQPISGYTLFYNGERFVTAYVACHMENDKTHIEFIAREPANFLDLKLGEGRFKKALRVLKPITKAFLRTDEFHKVYSVEGECTLYEYV